MLTRFSAIVDEDSMVVAFGQQTPKHLINRHFAPLPTAIGVKIAQAAIPGGHSLSKKVFIGFVLVSLARWVSWLRLKDQIKRSLRRAPKPSESTRCNNLSQSCFTGLCAERQPNFLR